MTCCRCLKLTDLRTVAIGHVATRFPLAGDARRGDMKRLLTLLLVFAATLLLAACGGGDDDSSPADETEPTESAADTQESNVPTFSFGSRDDLKAAIEADIEIHGWAAGCLYHQNKFDLASDVEAGYLAGVDRSVELASATLGTSGGGAGLSTVYIPDSALAASGDLISTFTDGYYCLRPPQLP
jgi:hypothetical protein